MNNHSSVKLISSIHEPIWSGSRISHMFPRFKNNDKIGEAWETSVNPDALSMVSSENDIIGFDRFLKLYNITTPPLVKLLDADVPLSIQVHPDQLTASKYGSVSKSEIWYVLAADNEASILYGTKEGITLDEVRSAIFNGNVETVMCTVPVQPGDIFMIPCGMLHSLGGGITVLEVQDREGTTYRVKDIMGNRTVHIDESADSVRIYSANEASKLAYTSPKRAASLGINGDVIASTENYAVIRHKTSSEASEIPLRKGMYVFCEKGSCYTDDTELVIGDSVFTGSNNTTLRLAPHTSVIIVY